MNSEKISLIVVLVSMLNSCISKDKENQIKYHDNGHVRSIRSFNSEGLPNGQSIWFYPNGFVEQQISFINGLAHGHAFYFYENGAIKSHRYYNNDKLNGFTTDYFNDSIGLIKNIVLFENGKVIEIRKGDSAFAIINDK